MDGQLPISTPHGDGTESTTPSSSLDPTVTEEGAGTQSPAQSYPSPDQQASDPGNTEYKYVLYWTSPYTRTALHNFLHQETKIRLASSKPGFETLKVMGNAAATVYENMKGPKRMRNDCWDEEGGYLELMEESGENWKVQGCLSIEKEALQEEELEEESDGSK